MSHDVAGPWGVRVLSERCVTCIFRPGNAMQLRPIEVDPPTNFRKD